MKAYKNDLREFYSKKSAIDEQLKKKLKKYQSLDKKKEVIEKSKQQREEEEVDEDALITIRKPYIRMVDYLKQIDEQLKILYEQYNEFKLNILYDHANTYNYNANMPEYSHLKENQVKDFQVKEFDDITKKFEEDIDILKKLKTKHILKINKKKEVDEEVKKGLKMKISERQQEYNEADNIEEKKQIYLETVELKLQLFELFRENISIVNVESKTDELVYKYSTMVIDYTPIKNNQKKITDKLIIREEKEEPVELGEEELGDVELGQEELEQKDNSEYGYGNEPHSPNYKASESF